MDGNWLPTSPDWVDYPATSTYIRNPTAALDPSWYPSRSKPEPRSDHSEFLEWVYTLGDDDRRWVVAWCLQYTDPTHPLVTDYYHELNGTGSAEGASVKDVKKYGWAGAELRRYWVHR